MNIWTPITARIRPIIRVTAFTRIGADVPDQPLSGHERGVADQADDGEARTSLNLSWSPIERIDLVGEFLTGRRLDKDGQSGTAAQFQFGGRFRF